MTDTDVRSTASLRAQGLTLRDVARKARSGELVKVRHGSWTEEAAADDVARHLQLIAACESLLSPEAVFSYASAAVLHELPTWDSYLGKVSVDRQRDRSGRLGTSVHVRPVELDPSDVTTIDGRRVTDLARTVVDCARSLPYELGVAVADAGLHRGVSLGQLVHVVSAKPRRVGNPRARAVIDFADGRSESVGESLSRVVMAAERVPVPVLQFEVIDPRTGEIVARCDFGWPELGVVGEFDGRVKYGRLLRPGETAGDAVYREKRREDAVRATGVRMIRWGWDDLKEARAFGSRLRRFLAS